jgi:O-antigen/teichoic acid export membrane protein
MSGVNLLVIAVILLYYANVLAIDKEKLLYLYFLQFIIQGVGLAWLYVSYYVQIPTLKYPNYNEGKLLFRFAIIALSANLAYYLINRIDYLFVEAYCTKKALGNYVQVSKMGQLLLIIPTIISSAIYPHAARGNNAIVVKLIFRTIALFVVLYILIGVISVLWSHQIFTLVFGPTFDEMYVPYLIVLPGILFLSVHILIAAYFGGNNRPFINLITTSAGLLVVLAGDLLLIKTMGIVGAALVSTLGYCTACIVSLVLFIKRTKAAWREIFSSDIIKIDTYTSLFYPKINAGK